MRRVLITACLIFAGFTVAASAKHRVRCEIRHPGYYFQSLGKRHHARYGVNHFRRFHLSVRPALRPPFRTFSPFRPGFSYRKNYRPRYYRRAYPRPPVRFRRDRGTRIRFYIDW